VAVTGYLLSFLQVHAAAANLGSGVPEQRPRLHFLDFERKLLSPDGSELAAEFTLDGTHLSPAYLPTLQAAFLEVL
jgi:hypothetical protein